MVPLFMKNLILQQYCTCPPPKLGGIISSVVNGLNPVVSVVCDVCIVRVSVVLKRSGVGDERFDSLSGSHLQSQLSMRYSLMVLGCFV